MSTNQDLNELDGIEGSELKDSNSIVQDEIKLKEVNKNYSKYLIIKKNEVQTKYMAQIRLDLEEYRNIKDNEHLSQEDLELVLGEDNIDGNERSFSIPGTLEILFPEEGVSLNIFLPYSINLVKTEDSIINSKEMIFNYEPGDTIFTAFVKKNETNIDTLGSLFENRVRYLRGYLPEQHETIWANLSNTSNVKAIHLSSILSMLYAKNENGSNKYIRHTTAQRYSKEYAIGTKESAHIFGEGLSSSLYGYVGDALNASVFKDRKNNFSPEPEGMFLGKIDTGLVPKLEDSKQAVLLKLDGDLQKHQASMAQRFSDLENIVGARYEALQAKKPSGF